MSGVTCQLSHITCHLSHVTNANSHSHRPSYTNSPTMHVRLVCQARHFFCLDLKKGSVFCNVINKLLDQKSQVHTVPGPARWLRTTTPRKLCQFTLYYIYCFSLLVDGEN